MPDPKTCAAKGLQPGTKEYEDCIAYKGAYEKKAGVKKPGAKKPRKIKGPMAQGGGY